MLIGISIILGKKNIRNSSISKMKKIWVYLITPIYQVAFIGAIVNSISQVSGVPDLKEVGSVLISLVVVFLIMLCYILSMHRIIKESDDYVTRTRYSCEEKVKYQFKSIYNIGIVSYVINSIYLYIVISISVKIFLSGFIFVLFVIPVFIAGVVAMLSFIGGSIFFLITFIMNYRLVAIYGKNILYKLDIDERQMKKYRNGLIVPFYQLKVIRTIIKMES